MSDFACRMYHHGPWCDARCRKAYPLHAGASDCTHGPAALRAPAPIEAVAWSRIRGAMMTAIDILRDHERPESTQSNADLHARLDAVAHLCEQDVVRAISRTHPAPAQEVREVRIGEEDDEIVTHGVIHVERMSDRHIWANLGGVSFDFVVVKGKLVWRVQDMEWADLPRAYAALTPDAEGGA